MRGRNLPFSSSMAAAQIQRSNRSPLLLYTLSLLALSILFILVFLSPSNPNPSSFLHPISSLKPETSFVTSLEDFLNHKAPKSPPLRDDTVRALGDVEEASRKLDEALSEAEMERVVRDPYYPLGSPIRVYVYEMPWKFTYDLLWLFWNTYRETSNLTSNGSPVHRLIEQVFDCVRYTEPDFFADRLYMLLHSPTCGFKNSHYT